MRNLGLAFAMFILAFSFSAQRPAAAAGSLPWCASTEAGSVDCAYISLQQCLAATSANGDSCGLNPNSPAANAFAMGSTARAKKELRKK